MTQADRDRLVALKKAKKKLITQKEAAEELGITERQVRRLLKALKRRGDQAVVHALRGQRSNRKLDEDVKKEALKILSQADVPGLWADTGVGILGQEAQDRSKPGDVAQSDDRGEAVASTHSSVWGRFISGARGGAGMAKWCSGTPASMTGWKGVARRCC